MFEINQPTNQPTTFTTKCLVEVNDDVYILVKETIIGIGAGADAPARQADERNKKILFKSFAPFTALTA